MVRWGGPIALFAAVVVGAFGLAKWHPFSPSAAPAGGTAAGDARSGATVFGSTCAGCHGAGGAGGGVGPRLQGSGLTAAGVLAVIASGRGVMPSGLVQGRQAADVAAYVASIAQ